MKNRQSGFTILEIIIASAIALVICAAGAMVVYRVFFDNNNVSNHLTINYQLDRAGYWISHDTQMSYYTVTQGLSSPNILVLNCMNSSDLTSYSITYSVQNISNNIGTLTRQNSKDNSTLVMASNIYYNPSDTVNSTQADYTNGKVNLIVTTKTGSIQNTKTYLISPRPDYVGF